MKVYFDGVFKGDYSLAVVNRCLAQALIEQGVQLSCFAQDAGWQTDPLLQQARTVRARMLDAPACEDTFDVHLRNTWPPHTRDMIGRCNAYVCFAWEESEFPANLVERFNRDLDLVMVASNFVKRALVESGVTIPVEVVGEGADHVLAIAPPPARGRTAKRRLLHISSGFRRKGVDCLLDAYRQTFTASDDVELLIKTFPNLNNEIPKLVAGLRESKDSPPLRIIDESYSHAELLDLYRTATAIVAPSRGEGFGLPLAEAMALGVPVVTTNYSGQTDFCRPDNSWLVDYTLSAANAHVSGSFSLWANPDVAHLGRQMNAVLRDTDEVAKRTARAKSFIESHVTWRRAAQRTLFAMQKHDPRRRRIAVSTQHRQFSIDIVTSWNRNCGIATYASHLYRGTALSSHVSAILAQKHGNASDGADDRKVSRIWGDNREAMLALAARLGHGAADVLWMQHHPGHFSTPDMQLLTAELGTASYKSRIVTLHSVTEAARGGSLAWTSAFDTAFVHSAGDAEVLSRAGHRNPVVVPHGFMPAIASETSSGKPTFDIGTFGFLSPHKNVELLVCAFGLARRFAPNLRLHLFNCTLPNDASRATQAIVENLIDQSGLSDVVQRNYDFIPEDGLIAELSRCDLFVFPYGHTNETATGAARIALSANRPILCSQSSVLRDLHPVSHVLRDLSVECLAEAMISLSQSSDLLSLYDHQRANMLRHHSYERMAVRYLGHILQSLDGHDEYRRAA